MLATELFGDLPLESSVDGDDDLSTPHERILVVLDDDPTGTQSVRDLPVLTAWEEDDLEWALRQGSPAIYVVTNSRSLAEEDAANRVREVATRALRVAARLGLQITLVARGDSTLRGHHPAETDALEESLNAVGDGPVDLLVLVPAFPAAGRVTVHGVHYCVQGELAIPVGESEFAQDATFGYSSSRLADWIEEKTQGRVRADDVVSVSLDTLRSASVDAIERLLTDLPSGSVVAPDIAAETDLLAIARSVRAAERAGRRVILRAGPPFARAYIGQQPSPPLTSAQLPRPSDLPAQRGGIVVVGSHVDRTQQQLKALRARFPALPAVEIDVGRVLDEAQRGPHLASVVREATDALTHGDVILQTTRLLVTGTTPDDSLRLSRAVSAAVSEVVARIVARVRPRFVIAKGGITSSDVAVYGLGIRRAWARGSLFDGLVSLWEPEGGPADGIGYIVFAGNVGDEQSLADAVDRFHHTSSESKRS